MTSKPLSRSFFNRPTLTVAQELLGAFLIRETNTGWISARIVDVEAYIGQNDKACHASKGRTKRTEVMFGPAGVTYIYLVYGMHHCLNLVTERIDFPAAVLIRGIEVPLQECSDVKTRIDGPGRTCKFLGLDRTFNNLDTTQGRGLWIEPRSQKIDTRQILALPRVGVDYAGKWAHKLWRFCLPDSTRNSPRSS